jgi:tight adherence protein B
MTVPIIIALFFFAVALGIIALYLGYMTFKESPFFAVRKRLRDIAMSSEEALPSDIRVEIIKEMLPIERFLLRYKIFRKLNHLIEQAGLRIDMKLILLIIILSSAAGFFIGFSLQRGIIIPLIFMIFGAYIPVLYLRIKRAKRIESFTEQLPQALEMIARSLRAGHSLSAAISIVGSESPEPVATLFKNAYEEQTLGLTLTDALARMLERMPSMDLRLFVTSVSINREIGGNLAELLDKLANTIRERLRIRRQIRVYTAQGRLSGYILAVLPIFMAFMLYLIAPDYIAELINIKTGRYAIGLAITAQIIGFLVIRRLINIKI